jgi:hypothetical protein
MEKQAPVKVKSDAEPTMAANGTSQRISLSALQEGKTP